MAAALTSKLIHLRRKAAGVSARRILAYFGTGHTKTTDLDGRKLSDESETCGYWQDSDTGWVRCDGCAPY